MLELFAMRSKAEFRLISFSALLQTSFYPGSHIKNGELFIFSRENTDVSANIAAILVHIGHLDNCSYSMHIHDCLVTSIKILRPLGSTQGRISCLKLILFKASSGVPSKNQNGVNVPGKHEDTALEVNSASQLSFGIYSLCGISQWGSCNVLQEIYRNGNSPKEGT